PPPHVVPASGGRATETLLVQGAACWIGPGRLVDDAAVVVRGSRLAYAGPAAAAPPADHEVAGDWFLMPGVVDHHVHIRLSRPEAVLGGGVTAARDLAWPPEEIFPLVDISQATDFDGPALSAAGPMITAPGGYPSRAGWCPAGGWIEVRGPEEAAGAVERVAALDPAVIKVALNADAGPTLSDRELVAACDAAHAGGLRVAAHAQGAGQTERALGAGVDELAHCPWTERLSDDLIRALARRMTITSTLEIHSYGRRTPELDLAVDNLRRFVQAGGRVRYGTDLGNGPIPPGCHPGEAAHLAAAGLGVDAILAAMTRGPLEEGAPADVIGLGGDPFEGLGALGRVRFVVRGGRVRKLDR
ncbi:MAG TPA: amidohydrolase family protein, partial [Actinomycetota bacterium]|nr:amidohydrolase family protein [Actinomycetota bacterium]